MVEVKTIGRFNVKEIDKKVPIKKAPIKSEPLEFMVTGGGTKFKARGFLVPRSLSDLRIK